METWVPLAIVSISTAVFWVCKCCTEDRPSASEPNDFNVLGLAGDSFTEASMQRLGELTPVREGPPEAWKRMFSAPQEPKPEPSLRLLPYRGVEAVDELPQPLQPPGPRNAHQHGERPIRIVRGDRA